MLASTVQFSTNKQPPPRPAPPDPNTPTGGRRSETRNGPASKKHPPRRTSSAPSGPNSVPTNPHRHQPTLHAPAPEGTTAVLAGRPQPDIRTGQRSTLEHHPDTPPPPTDRAGISFWHGPGPAPAQGNRPAAP